MLTLGTIGRFFIGDPQAIATIANCRPALWLGAVLVLSAGFAREYDGEDLLHEPWHLLLPLAASLVSSLLLYLLLFLASWGKPSDRPRFLSDYRRFLTLYWMTAPLAWVYAIPVEHFLSAPDAVRANFWFLGIVSLWRVLLISRASSILFGASFKAALLLVLFFADTLVLALLWATPIPVFSVMGGIRLTESEGIIQATHFIVQALGFVTWPVWFIAACMIIFKGNEDWDLLPRNADHTSISPPVWLIASASLLVWAFVLPFTQPPQQLRRTVETQFRDGKISDAVLTLAKHSQDDLPPHWDPPPRIGYGDDMSILLLALEATAELPANQWAREVYVDKLTTQFRENYFFLWQRFSDEDLTRFSQLLHRLPELKAVTRDAVYQLRDQLTQDTKPNEARTAAIRSVLEAQGIAPPEPSAEDVAEES